LMVISWRGRTAGGVRPSMRSANTGAAHAESVVSETHAAAITPWSGPGPRTAARPCSGPAGCRHGGLPSGDAYEQAPAGRGP
jgi:hypothetical protein